VQTWIWCKPGALTLRVALASESSPGINTNSLSPSSILQTRQVMTITTRARALRSQLTSGYEPYGDGKEDLEDDATVDADVATARIAQRIRGSFVDT
jgi:hypothetical protein